MSLTRAFGWNGQYRLHETTLGRVTRFRVKVHNVVNRPAPSEALGFRGSVITLPGQTHTPGPVDWFPKEQGPYYIKLTHIRGAIHLSGIWRGAELPTGWERADAAGFRLTLSDLEGAETILNTNLNDFAGTRELVWNYHQLAGCFFPKPTTTAQGAALGRESLFPDYSHYQRQYAEDDDASGYQNLGWPVPHDVYYVAESGTTPNNGTSPFWGGWWKVVDRPMNMIIAPHEWLTLVEGTATGHRISGNETSNNNRAGIDLVIDGYYATSAGYLMTDTSLAAAPAGDL